MLTIVAAAALAAPAAAAGGKTVTGDGFTTKLPAGWSAHVKVVSGEKQWLWGSPGTTVNTLGIPTKGGIGVNAFVETAAELETQLQGGAPSDPVALLGKIVGEPKGATHVKVVTKAHAIALAGVKAGVQTVSYTYKKRALVQTDVVARRASQVFVIELDVDKVNAAKGQAALRSIRAAWKYTN